MNLIFHAATLVTVIQAWAKLIHKKVVHQSDSPVTGYGPLLNLDRKKMTNLNYINNKKNIKAMNMLRMLRLSFCMLVETFSNRGLLEDNIHTSMEEQVVIFLHVVGHNQRFRARHIEQIHGDHFQVFQTSLVCY